MIINGNPMVIPWNYPLLRPKSSWTCGSWALHFGTIRLHLPAASWKTLRLNEHDKMGWFEVGETFWNGICFTVRLDSLVGDLCFSCLILFLFFELVWLVDMIFMQKTWMFWLVNGARSEIRLGSPILGIGRLHTHPSRHPSLLSKRGQDQTDLWWDNWATGVNQLMRPTNEE